MPFSESPQRAASPKKYSNPRMANHKPDFLKWILSRCIGPPAGGKPNTAWGKSVHEREKNSYFLAQISSPLYSWVNRLCKKHTMVISPLDCFDVLLVVCLRVTHTWYGLPTLHCSAWKKATFDGRGGEVVSLLDLSSSLSSFSSSPPWDPPSAPWRSCTVFEA